MLEPRPCTSHSKPQSSNSGKASVLAPDKNKQVKNRGNDLRRLSLVVSIPVTANAPRRAKPLARRFNEGEPVASSEAPVIRRLTEQP